MFELPIPEDIYDYDTFALRDIVQKIEEGLLELGEGGDKPKETLSWIKKAKKIHGMISLELEERRAVEEFEDFCQKGEDYIKGLENFNPYEKKQEDFSKENNETKQQKVSFAEQIEHSQVSTASQSSMTRAHDTVSEISTEKETEITDRKSVTTLSEEQGSRIYNTMHHAKKKKQNKKNALFEFMKQTLEATRATSDTMSIGKSAVDNKLRAQPVEEHKEMHRKEHPSVSSVAAGGRKAPHSLQPIRNAPKAPTNNRPIQRPDPNFNPSDTRVGAMLDLGGFSKPSTASKIKKDIEAKMAKKDKKEKTPSLKEIKSDKEEESGNKFRIRKSKTIDENEGPKSESLKASKVKENKPEVPTTKESKESKQITSTNKAANKEKQSTVVDKSKAGKTSGDKEVRVSQELKGGMTKSEESKKLQVSVDKVINKEAEENSISRSQSSKSSTSSIKNFEEIENIDEKAEEEEEEKKENVRLENKERNEKIAQSSLNEIQNKTQDQGMASIKLTDQEKITKSSLESQQFTPKISDISNSKTNPLQDMQEFKEREPKNITSEEKIKNESKISTETKPTKTFSVKSENVLKSNVDENKHREKTLESEERDFRVDIITPTADRIISTNASQDLNKEDNKNEAENSYDKVQTATNERIKDRDTIEKSLSRQVSQKDSMSYNQEKVQEQNRRELNENVVESSHREVKSPTQAGSNKYEMRSTIELNSKTSRSGAQSSTPQVSSDQTGMYLDYNKALFPRDNNKSSSSSASYTRPESTNQTNDERSEEYGEEEDRDTDLRSSLTGSQLSKGRGTPKSDAKATSLPKIDSKTKDKKTDTPSPTKSKSKTSLPSIEGNKLSFSAQRMKELSEDNEPPKSQEIKRVSDLSSPSRSNQKSTSVPSSSSSSNRTENTSAQKQGERKAQADDGKKLETQLKEISKMAPPRSRNATAGKPPSNKVPKGYDYPQIAEEDVVDYSNFFQSFQDLFSGSNLKVKDFDYLGVMRELHNMFAVHSNAVDNMDTLLAKYKPSIAPLELGPNDLIAQNNINHILMYSTKTNIDLRVYLERQKVFNQNVSLLKYGQDPDDPEETVAAKDTLYYRVVKTKSEVYDIISRSFLRKKNWVELPHGMNLKTTWNLIWTWGKPQIDMNKLLVFQKVNHFPGNKGIVRKDLLKANLERIQKLGQKASAAFNILPATFTLPKEITKFIEVFYENHEKEGIYNIWIIKPVGKSRGRGISLINDLGGLKYTETIVAQKYLKNPLLLNGFKFDMRIYVLVTSMNPLEAFIYKEGFARLSTVPFNLNAAELNNLFIHLTNSSVQKNSGVIDQTSSDTIVGGTKISLKTLRQRLERKGVPWDPIWTQVGEIVVKSLLACQHEVSHHPNAFELFGYDVMIDSDLRCWLIEVNSSPSLERSNILDDLVKQQLVDDIIDLVSPVNFDRARLVQVLERRIGEEQRLKSTINTMNNSKIQLNKDLTYILHGKKLREVGELPENMGNFDILAPTDMSEKFSKLIQSYKVQYKTPMQQDNKK